MKYPKNKKSVLMRLVSDGLRFDYILDVGVMRQTQELRELFPTLRQYLFEPVPEFHDHIERLYADNDYELIRKAVGARAGQFRLFQYSVSPGEPVTHSRLPKDEDESPRNNETETQVEVITLDGFADERGLEGTCLLKIDIDGNELEVLEGAEKTLDKVACVIIEANKYNLYERLGVLRNRGFVLYEMCDLCYYDDVFIQCDLVLLNPKRVDVSAFNPIIRDGGVKFEKWRKA